MSHKCIESVVTVLCAWDGLPRLRYTSCNNFRRYEIAFFHDTPAGDYVSCGTCALSVDCFVYANTRTTPLTGAGARERNDPTIRRMCTLCTAVKRTVQPSMFETKMCFVRRTSMIQELLRPTSEEAFASQKSNPKRDRRASRKARRTRHTGTASATRPSVEYSYMHFPSISDRH